MKKNLFFGAIAATMLLASCQTEADLGLNGGDGLVTINLSTPEIATRAYSDGTMAQNLQYAVYAVNGDELDYLPALTVTDATINLQTKVQLQLTTGNQYRLVFWADAETAPYEVDFAAKTMTIDYNGVVSNREDMDAFYTDTLITVTGRMEIDVDMYRPFAQLNIGTSDFAETADAGYAVTSASVTTDTYSTFNFISREVTNPVEVTYAMNRVVRDAQPTEVFPVAGYDYVAMNYVLMTKDKSVNDYVKLTYTDGVTPKTRTFTTIPLQRNYRTNIYGQLFTSDVDVNVEIIPTYYDDIEYPNNSKEELLLAAAVGGEVTLQEDVVLDEPVEVKHSMFLHLNGKTITNKVNNIKTDVIIVKEGATLTIDGEGTIAAVTGNDGYAVISEGEVIINGGTYKAGVDGDGEANAVIYARGNGKVYVNGGVFTNEFDSPFVLNKKDAHRATTVIEVTGGKFRNFDPANNAAEGANTNFVKEGYKSIANGEFFEVVFDGEDIVVNGTVAEVYTAEGLLKWGYMANHGEQLDLKLMCGIVMPAYAIVENAAEQTYEFGSEPITVTDGIPSGSNWMPVTSTYDEAVNGTLFTGKIEGQNNAISGLRIANNNFAVGFVGYMNKGASIENVVFDNAVVYSKDASHMGIVVGRAQDGTLVNNVHVKNSAVKGSNEVGGIVGRNYRRKGGASGQGYNEALAYVKNCTIVSSTVTVSGSTVGGICGRNYGAVLENCINSANVTGKTEVGGIVGYTRDYFHDADGYVIACGSTADATITATNGNAGGIAGVSLKDNAHANTLSSIVACYSASTISAKTPGTIIGSATNATIIGSWALTNGAEKLSGHNNPVSLGSFNYDSAADVTAADVDAMNAAIANFNNEGREVQCNRTWSWTNGNMPVLQ